MMRMTIGETMIGKYFDLNSFSEQANKKLLDFLYFNKIVISQISIKKLRIRKCIESVNYLNYDYISFLTKPPKLWSISKPRA